VKAFLVLAGVLITCYIVAFGLLLGTAVVARAARTQPPSALLLTAPERQLLQGLRQLRTPP
jgi:hypothetical protein